MQQLITQAKQRHNSAERRRAPAPIPAAPHLEARQAERQATTEIPLPTQPMAGLNARSLLRLHVRGLEVDAQSGEGGVVNLAVRTQEQDKGVFGRLRQHLAHTLFRAGDLCHPGHHHSALRVVQLQVPATAVNDGLADRRDANAADVWPVHGADGDAHYQPLLVHEGVKRHHDGRAARDEIGSLGGKQGADDAHALSPLKTDILNDRAALIWPDDDSDGVPLTLLEHRLFTVGGLVLMFLVSAAITLLLCTNCRAEPVTVWANLGGVSLHDAPGRNGFNPGLGLELRTSTTWAFGAGQYRNSERLTSHYAVATYTPWQPIQGLHVGALFGVVDGYPLRDRQAIPAAALVAEVRWRTVAITGTFIPTLDRAKAANTLGVQVKVNFGGL
jgi:hypothetical protein